MQNHMGVLIDSTTANKSAKLNYRGVEYTVKPRKANTDDQWRLWLQRQAEQLRSVSDRIEQAETQLTVEKQSLDDLTKTWG